MPHGHYKTTTAALRASGPFAVNLVDGATNGVRFRGYVTDTLAPALELGDTVILDDLPPLRLPLLLAALNGASGRLRP